MIPYGRQDISEADIEAVVDVLRSDWLTQGPVVPQFESALAEYCGAREGVAVNSATAALHIACLALGLGPGDRLWTSANTFAASANCARYCGADVDFVDIDPGTYTMGVEALAAKLDAAERSGKLPKIVVPVHFAGQSCDMAAIAELASRYGFRIIEDAAHAIGGTYRGRPLGSCEFSDIAVFSFHPVKIITTGEGGMALCRDPALAARMRRLRSHGITRSEAEMEQEPEGPWYYEQLELGLNYRMTDFQAALGLSQFARLPEFIEGRHAVARRYDAALAAMPLVLPAQAGYGNSAYHLYPVQVRGDAAAGRPAVFSHLRERGIGVNVHYLPVYLHPYYRRLGFLPGYCPEAENYYSRAISLPLFPGLSPAEQERVVLALAEVLHG